MNKTKITYLFFVFFFFAVNLSACNNSDGNENDTPYQYLQGDPVDGVRIAWDFGTFRQLTTRGGYARAIRLKDNTVIAVYENYNTGVEMRRSTDDGHTWNEPVILFDIHQVTNDKGTTRVNIANAEIIQLTNGDLITACNYRPQTYEITPFSIVIRRSTDNGLTWHDPQVIYEAEPRFNDGCWEPSFLELPNGQIQVYFANEAPYTHSDEQEIGVLTSVDNGISWGNYKTVCFRSGSRDGMPVCQLVGDEIVCVIEDCGFVTFKPYTVRTKISDNWSAPVFGDSPNREIALKEPVEDWIYMGAPYLGKLPTGETLLSYQVDDKIHDDQFGDRLAYSTMEVAIGDENARNFTRRTRPFPIPDERHAIWPAIHAWDANTIAVLVCTDYIGAVQSPCFMKGYVIRDLKINFRDITEYPIFIGHRGKNNLRMGVGKDKTNLHVNCKVNDTELFSAGDGTQKGSGVYIYLDAENTSYKEPGPGVFKIWCNYTGEVTVWQGKNGQWQEDKLEGLKVSPATVTGGYEIALTVPLQNTFNHETMRIGATLSTKTYTETLVHGDADKPNTWLRMDF